MNHVIGVFIINFEQVPHVFLIFLAFSTYLFARRRGTTYFPVIQQYLQRYREEL